MRFVIFSDLHIHPHPDFDKEIDGTSSRLKDCLEVLDRVVMYYDKYECDGVIFCGDMFHVPDILKTVIYEPAYRRLEQLTEHVKIFIAIAGNHDMADVSKGGPAYSTVYPVSRLSNSHLIVGATQTIDCGKVAIHGLPYIQDEDEFVDQHDKLLMSVEASRKFHNIVLTHCGINEAVNGPNEIKLRGGRYIRDFADVADYVFAGHHHHPQRLANNAVVVGSPIQHNMLDRNDDRGILIYDTDNSKITRVWFKFSRFFLFEFNNPEDLDKYHAGYYDLTDNYVRFIFRYTPPREIIRRLEEDLERKAVRGKEIKIQRAPLHAVRNEKLTLKLVKSNNFKACLPDYVNHVKPKGLNRLRLVKVGRKLLHKASV